MILNTVLYNGQWITVGLIQPPPLYDNSGKLKPIPEVKILKIIV